MTDRPADPAPDIDLELASALHDGAASAEERARADDPAVRAAQARIAAVAARVADVPPPPAGLLDAHVAAALAALDDEAADGAEATGTGSVAALADRRPWWQRAPLGAVAAAIAVVALVGAIGLAAGGDDPRDDTATAALDAAGDEAGGEAGMTETDGSGDTTLRASEREAFATYDELASALTVRLDSASPTSGAADAAPTADEAAEAAPAAPPTAACDPVAAAGLDPVTVQMVVSAVVDGQPIVAVVHDDNGDPVVTSVDEAACTVTDRRPLPRS